MTDSTRKLNRMVLLQQFIGAAVFSGLKDISKLDSLKSPGSGIYLILNTANARVYVGQSIAIAQRLRQHIYTLQSRKHHNQQLQADWVAFGASNFKCGILEFVDPIKALLDIKEDDWIDKLRTLDPLNGYNQRINGDAGSVTYSSCEHILLREWVAIRRLSDGYWCATALCDQFNRQAENWTRTPFIRENKHLIQKSSQNPDKGIWCHPGLVLDLSIWTSPCLYLAYISYLKSIIGDDFVPKAFKALGFDVYQSE